MYSWLTEKICETNAELLSYFLGSSHLTLPCCDLISTTIALLIPYRNVLPAGRPGRAVAVQSFK